MPRKYNGKGAIRCQGNNALAPEQIVPPSVLTKLGERFKARKNRDWRKTGPRGRMQVRCYWYQQDRDTGLLIPVKQITQSRMVDNPEWLRPEDPASKWIRGWVVWGREYVEVRKEIGDRYWKTMRLVGEGEWDGRTETKSGALDWGQPIQWPRDGPGAQIDSPTGNQIPGSDEEGE